MLHKKLFYLVLVFLLSVASVAFAAPSKSCTIITDVKTQQIFYQSDEECEFILGVDSPLDIDPPQLPIDSPQNEYMHTEELANGWTLYGLRNGSWQAGGGHKQQAWYAGWVVKDERMLSFISAVIEGAPAKGSAAHRLQKSFIFEFTTLMAEQGG